MGTRWPVGGAAPDNLPEVVVYAVQAVEEELAAGSDDTSAWKWTLTWLEGKPVVELDNGTVIRFNAADDSATITQPSSTVDDDDDWI